MDENGDVSDVNKSNEPEGNEMDENGDVSDVDKSNETEDDETDAEESENFADESSASDSEGNAGWADAMGKVLHASVKSQKFILSKALKDTDIKPKEKKIEFVDESGNIIEEKPKPSESQKEKRKKMLEKQRLKAQWEAMCHVKPDITNKDREREFVKIATRGVVHLFNSVEQHQKTNKNPKKNHEKNKKVSVMKGNFMDILKEYSKKDKEVQEDPVVKKVKHEETWSILKDNFMMGAEMKDWDKDEDT
ncbi:RRP15-like protein [Trichonephila clavata]|uniref:RRP15-like protein n=1 Tax=Trichonephila clavata TaxID=2740835 RepID=A0A8X6HGA2_TRICU|nr:RRP15-like protein [Trichonephila clavata]